MKKNLKDKKVIILILLMMVILLSIGASVQAITSSVIDFSKKASLTITKYEHANGSEENIELAGVEFTVYAIPNNIEGIDEAEEYVQTNEVLSYTKTTPNNGTITFSDLDLGRYYVVETNSPKNVLEKVESFLIDLPRTSDNGATWEYNVTVYPKNITIYGSVTLTNTSEEGAPLEGTIWKLQKQNDSGRWDDYDEIIYTTNQDGMFIIQDLEVGNYKLIEKTTLDGYILDATDQIHFNITQDNRDKEFTVINEKLDIEKYVMLSDGSYGKDVGKFSKEYTCWKTVADVSNIITKMNDYCITEVIEQGMILERNSLHIYGVDIDGNNTELPIDKYQLNINAQVMEINFLTNELEEYKNIIITYDTKFDDSVEYGEYKTFTNLTYTNYINENGDCISKYNSNQKEAEVHTGSVLIYKVNEQGLELKGASFKIATSKSNAENGVFVKDKDGNDIIATSDENGYVIFNGLKFGNDNEKTEEAMTSYWIVEVQAPSYQENGEIRYYNLLDKSVEIQVDSTSNLYSESDTTVVVNKKGFILPLTGGTLSLVSIILGIIIIFSSIFIRKKKFNYKRFFKCEKNN